MHMVRARATMACELMKSGSCAGVEKPTDRGAIPIWLVSGTGEWLKKMNVIDRKKFNHTSKRRRQDDGSERNT